ncbi:MAG: hypothetical protein JWO18_2904 [Microbacteriaceae bacterium]|nr:hypothetical protein [Microbacteriaceae bacterium]
MRHAKSGYSFSSPHSEQCHTRADPRSVGSMRAKQRGQFGESRKSNASMLYRVSQRVAARGDYPQGLENQQYTNE